MTFNKLLFYFITTSKHAYCLSTVAGDGGWWEHLIEELWTSTWHTIQPVFYLFLGLQLQTRYNWQFTDKWENHYYCLFKSFSITFCCCWMRTYWYNTGCMPNYSTCQVVYHEENIHLKSFTCKFTRLALLN